MRLTRPLLVLAAACCLLAGCAAAPSIPKPHGWLMGGASAGGGFRVLDVLASLCAVAAVLSIVFATWLRVAPKTTLTLVFCAVGCWTLRALLNDYLWIIEALAVVGLCLFGFVSFHSIVAWLERYFGIDFNRDGTIGARPRPGPVPSGPAAGVGAVGGSPAPG